MPFALAGNACLFVFCLFVFCLPYHCIILISSTTISLQLLYVSSLDVSGLDLNLPDGPFAVNIWSKESIDAVLAADLQINGTSYGKLEVSPVLFLMCIRWFLTVA